MDIFKALADRHRRRIIEKLHNGGALSIKQLTEDSSISRQATTKHLDILIKSKIVTFEFIGKERLHRLNPRAIQSLSNWLEPFSQEWEDRLDKLNKHLGDNNE